MHRFPKASVLPKYSFVKYDFGPGLGHHVSSAANRALLSRLSTLMSSSGHQSIVLPDFDADSSYNRNRKTQLENAASYVDDLMAGHEVQEHTALNVERQDMYDIDQFFISIELTLDPTSYASVASNGEGGRRRVKFQRMPFQQLMMLDSIFTMINRSGLSEHRSQILMHIKSSLGYDWLTCTKADLIQNLFSVRVVGHNVRRRMGKSVAVYADLARCLAFFPMAGIKALYTVHMAHAARECHSAVAKAVESFVDLFNLKQREKFQERIDARGGSFDPQDFYYQARHVITHTSSIITVNFYKMNREGDCNSGRPISKNTLLCKGYTQQDVSLYMIYTFLLFFRKMNVECMFIHFYLIQHEFYDNIFSNERLTSEGPSLLSSQQNISFFNHVIPH